MKTRTKIIIGSAVVLAAGLTFFLIKRRMDKRDQEELEKLIRDQAEETAGQALSTETTGVSQSGYVSPVRNRNNEVINPMSEVRGRMLYPANDSNDPVRGYAGALGKATLRTSAEVNTGIINNEIKVYESRQAIGTVIGSVKDNLEPAMRWFKVKMKNPCCGVFSDYTEGWVRADVVTFDKYKKTSGFDGNFVEKYDTSNQLGAAVFPHSGWNPEFNQKDTMKSFMFNK
jgi:hypothetical protein